jgi:hypothetical protein
MVLSENTEAVTERVIETLKYEWLKKVPVIRGYQHLVQLCSGFSEWYNIGVHISFWEVQHLQ